MICIRVAVAAALIVLTGCNRTQPPAPGAQAMPPVTVALAVAQTTDLEDATEYVATLKSLRSTTVQPQADGQIVEIRVKSGDRVSAGAPLVQIDARRQQAAVSSQQAERAAREADVAYKRQQQDRARQLFAAGAISRQEMEQTETAVTTAEADLKALDTRVQQQEVQLRYYTVNAPTSGVIGDVPVRVGNSVSTQTVLTTIDQNDVLEVYVSVPMERSGALKNGLPIELWSSDGTQQLARTTVSFIASRVDDETQSVLVKGRVSNPSGTLRPAQYVRARIVWAQTSGLVVPVTAVLRINGQFFAFVAEESEGKLVARQRPIKVGPIVGDNYTVLDGVKPGERIVVSGAQKLGDNAPIAAQP